MRAQISADFLIALTISLSVFLFLFVVIADRNKAFDAERRRLLAKDVADRFAAELNAIYISGPGTTKTVELPSSLKDSALYAINMHPEARVVEIIWRVKDNFQYYDAPIIGCLAQNLTNIIDDMNISGGAGCLDIEPSQEYFDVDGFCKGAGYESGTCVKGASKCESEGGTVENKGNNLCIREVAGVACCG